MTTATELGTITCPTACLHDTVFILMLLCSGLLLTSLLCSLVCARRPFQLFLFCLLTPPGCYVWLPTVLLPLQ